MVKYRYKGIVYYYENEIVQRKAVGEMKHTKNPVQPLTLYASVVVDGEFNRLLKCKVDVEKVFDSFLGAR